MLNMTNQKQNNNETTTPKWVLTDESYGYKQYVKKIDKDNYEVIEILPLPNDADDMYIFKFVKIDMELELMDLDSLIKTLKAFSYTNLEHVKELYGEESANWIIAECIAEETLVTDANQYKYLKDEESVTQLLKEYGITEEKRVDIIVNPQKRFYCSNCRQTSGANGWNDATDTYYPNNTAKLPDSHNSDEVVFICPKCQNGSLASEIIEFSKGEPLLPNAKFTVYHENEHRLKALFEHHLKVQTGVDVNLQFSRDEETNRLYVSLTDEALDDDRLHAKYNTEDWICFADVLCNEIFADGEDRCYPHYLEDTDIIEIFVEL